MLVERLNDDVKTVKEFCCSENALNASGGSEIMAVVRTRNGLDFENVEKFFMEEGFC